jgi:uncharacterized protein (UPF0548 family)
MCAVELTYAEVGATRFDDLPAGYRHVRRRAALGPASVLPAVVAGLRAWGIHRGAGLAVRTIAREPAVGVHFASGLGVGRLRLWVPCTVVWLRDDADGYGYGFGTRAGHPASATPAEPTNAALSAEPTNAALSAEPTNAALSGEEAFEVKVGSDGTAWFEIRAFSRPQSWYARWGGPVTRALQDRVTDRYVLAAQRLAKAD